MLTPVNHTEPVPRRVRGMVGADVVFDSTRALYVWEWPGYPQYYIPVDDVRPSLLVDEGRPQQTSRGLTRVQGLRVGDTHRPACARLHVESPLQGVTDTVRFDWAALDSWFEEDERVFVHPRSPYVRVDAVRSTRHVRIELQGEVLAESASPVLVFETGLPTRYYFNRLHVRFERLRPSATVTECPYKGTTSGYWSALLGGAAHEDVAWCYDFPTRQVSPAAGLIAFFNEKVDVILDGQLLERPPTNRSARS